MLEQVKVEAHSRLHNLTGALETICMDELQDDPSPLPSLKEVEIAKGEDGMVSWCTASEVLLVEFV